MFSTLMVERHNVTTVIFGGKPGEQMEYKGMAGNQVLEWFDLDSEVKTAGLKNVSSVWSSTISLSFDPLSLVPYFTSFLLNAYSIIIATNDSHHQDPLAAPDLWVFS
jgi:hypothetical protein